MKQIFIILIIFSCFLLTACVFFNTYKQEHRIEPNPYIRTEWLTNNKKDTMNCITKCTFDRYSYRFNINSATDTIELIINNSYVGSNVDSILINILMISDSSIIIVHPDASWVRIGAAKVLSGGEYTEECYIKSTTPVYVDMDLVVDPMTDNENPSYKEIIKTKSNIELRMDSVKKRLDSLINNIP